MMISTAALKSMPTFDHGRSQETQGDPRWVTYDPPWVTLSQSLDFHPFKKWEMLHILSLLHS